MKKRILYLSLQIFLVCAAFITCRSYTDRMSDIRGDVYSENYNAALKKLDEMPLANSDKDKVLYLMERGMLLYLNKQYIPASKVWEEASKKIEDLYTTSVTKAAGSLLVSEGISDYEGETFEQVLLPIFSGIGYFASGSVDGAAVEVKKSYNMLKELNQKYEGKNTYSRDSFLHYFSGLVYEAKKNWDAAIIEYRQALSSAKENRKFSKVDETLFARALAPLAEHRNRSEIIGEIRRDFPKLTWTPFNETQREGEVFVVYESGSIPLKVANDTLIPTGDTVIRVSFPQYKYVPSYDTAATILVNGQAVGQTEIAQDVGATAVQSLSDRRGRDITRMVARLVAKEAASRVVARQFGPLAGLGLSIAGAAAETADTRGWTTLPDKIQIRRVKIPSGVPVRVKVSGRGNTEETTVNLAPGEKKLIRVRGF